MGGECGVTLLQHIHVIAEHRVFRDIVNSVDQLRSYTCTRGAFHLLSVCLFILIGERDGVCRPMYVCACERWKDKER